MRKITSHLKVLKEKELENEKKFQEKIKSHKCYRCEWGKLIDNIFYCMFLRCQKQVSNK